VYAPGRRKLEKTEAELVAQHCLDGDQRRVEITRRYMVLVRGPKDDVENCTAALGRQPVYSASGSGDSAVIYDTIHRTTAENLFKMIRALRTLRVYLIVRGVSGVSALPRRKLAA
jgi:hypothetical protein